MLLLVFPAAGRCWHDGFEKYITIKAFCQALRWYRDTQPLSALRIASFII
jgi:hypothetical protein